MTEPTNLVKTQPDENHLYSATVASGSKTVLYAHMDDLPVSSTTSLHLAITVRADAGKTIDSGTLNLWTRYEDTSGAQHYTNSLYTASTIRDRWTRIELTATIPAGMTVNLMGVELYKTASLYMTNFTAYPLTGGRIVRARGANDGSKPTGVMTWNGTKGTLKTKGYSVDDVCTIQSDPNLKCINFVFE